MGSYVRASLCNSFLSEVRVQHPYFAPGSLLSNILLITCGRFVAMWGDYMESRLRAPEDPYDEDSCRSFPSTIFCGDSFTSSHDHSANDANATDDDEATIVEGNINTKTPRPSRPRRNYHRRNSSFWSEIACGELGDSSVLLSVCSAMYYTPSQCFSSDMTTGEETDEDLRSGASKVNYPAIEILYNKHSPDRRGR